ncbi:MAG: hypothetical protein IPM13_18295 [Phycisphaerales bacterium]|nr:hypothetical protein [Phycisphaerales bacterium]
MTGATVTWTVSFGGGRQPQRPRAAPGGGAPPVAQPPADSAQAPRVGPRRADAAARLARRLALAHHVEDLIERGVLRDHADAAAVLGISRPRMSQLAALLALSPAIQERILTGQLACSEREMRHVAAQPLWDEQTRMVEALAQRTHTRRAATVAADDQPQERTEREARFRN